jgi:hypothetical protein
LSQKENASPVNVPSNGKYPLLKALVQDGVSSDEDILRNISSLNFMDHDIIDAKKLLELAKDEYL